MNGGEINALYAVWGSGPDDIWAVGRGGAMARWNGTAWSVVAAGFLVRPAPLPVPCGEALGYPR